jgi:hypothetical protein
MHKGFRCLDVAKGRVYISCDVVFDESVYTINKHNPNASAHLRAVIQLLPSNLSPPSTFPSRDKFIDDSIDNMHVIPVSTNASHCP